MKSREPTEVVIEQMVGGGESWWYAICGGKVIGSSHEDDVDGMARLRAIRANALEGKLPGVNGVGEPTE